MLISAALGLVLCAWPASAQQWRTLRPGMEFSFLDAAESSRSGGSRLACLRLDPSLVRFQVLAVAPGEEGHTAGQWRDRTGALAVVNAGQFAADRSYLGLLVSGGKVQGHLAQQQEALFAAEPEVKGLAPARVIDLRYTAFRLEDSPYREVAQSLMLLDRFRQIRVRKSPKVANRTVVAEDTAGRILLMVSEGGAHPVGAGLPAGRQPAEAPGSDVHGRRGTVPDGGQGGRLLLRPVRRPHRLPGPAPALAPAQPARRPGGLSPAEPAAFPAARPLPAPGWRFPLTMIR